MKVMVFKFLVMVLVVLASCTQSNPAQTEARKFILDVYMGSVMVSHNGGTDWENVESGMELAQADMLKTAVDSYCDVIMPGRGLFRIENNTIVLLSKLNDEKDSINLKEGKVMVNITAKSEDGENFNVETAAAVVAVRGTEFIVENNEGVATTTVKEGTVHLRPNVEMDALAALSPEYSESFYVELGAEDTYSMNEAETKEIQETIETAKEVENPLAAVAEVKEKFKEKKTKVKDKESLEKAFADITKPEKVEKVEKAKKEKVKAEKKDKPALEEKDSTLENPLDAVEKDAEKVKGKERAEIEKARVEEMKAEKAVEKAEKKAEIAERRKNEDSVLDNIKRETSLKAPDYEPRDNQLKQNQKNKKDAVEVDSGLDELRDSASEKMKEPKGKKNK